MSKARNNLACLVLVVAFALSLFSLPKGASAYSLDLSCGPGGVLKGFQYEDAPIVQPVLSNDPNPVIVRQGRKSISTLCADLKACYIEFELSLSLAKQSAAVLQEFERKSSATLQELEREARRPDANAADIKLLVNQLNDMLSLCMNTRSFAPKSNPKEYTLVAAVNSRIRNKSSSQYDAESMRTVVKAALRAGVDPYLALAILVTETTPINGNGHSEYQKQFGKLPINAMGAADLFGCHLVKPEAKSQCAKDATCYGTLAHADQERVFDLRKEHSKASATVRVCRVGDVLKAGEPPKWTTSSKQAGQCCAKVTLKKGQRFDETDFNTDLAAEYVKRKIQEPLEEEFGKPNSHSLSYHIQAFNGRACFGCTEKSENSCLHKIHMGKMPVYGATVADTMVNLLMNNPEVRQMVAVESRKSKRPMKSIFCVQKGAGNFSIDALTFAHEQKRYLTDTKTRGAKQIAACTHEKGRADITFESWKSVGEARRGMGFGDDQQDL